MNVKERVLHVRAEATTWEVSLLPVFAAMKYRLLDSDRKLLFVV